MKNLQSGQILPFCMLLVAGLLLIVVSNFNIGFFNMKKVESQKKMDAVALEYGTQYARALNGLAALNEGLTIAAHRGEMVAAAALVLATCSAFPATAVVCKPLWDNLRPKLPGFYKHLSNLGEALVKQQDQITQWMTKQRCVDSTISWLTMSDFDMYPKFGCDETDEDLPFYRPEAKDIGDLKKCEVQTTNSYNEYREQLGMLDSEEDFTPIQIFYASIAGEKHIERPSNLYKAKSLGYTITLPNGTQMEPFTFQSATMEICKTFTGVLESIESNLAKLVNVPSPLVFKPEFFADRNRMIFISSLKSKSELDQISTRSYITKPSKIWALSEIKINGRDFQKMEFYPELAPVTLEEKLWEQLNGKFWKKLPDLETVKNEINH